LKGPLGIGDEILSTWDTKRKGDQVLHLISPADSIKDRLAAAIHWKDLNSARQAAEIARLHDVDLESLRAWCEAEGGAKIYSIFEVFLTTLR
jgi:hypothetical protein